MIGKHILADFFGCAYNLNDSHKLELHLRYAAKLSGSQVVHSYTHKFSPHGCSVTLVLAESHLTIHTWPESGSAAVDMYTCGLARPDIGVSFLSFILQPSRKSVREFIRGY